MSKFKDFLQSKKAKLLAVIMGVVAVMAVPLTASAAENDSTFPVTTQMLSDVTTNMNSAINVAVPVGIGVMSILLGVYLVPKIIKRLAK